MVGRAVDSEKKQARRAAILRAARDLFRGGDGDLPTASAIAAATGLAKGTVYLYFETKEEIFARLLLEGWTPVMDAVVTGFDSTTRDRAERVRDFIAGLVAHLQRHPELLRLDALGSAVLEKKMTPEALRRFKEDFTGHLVRAGSSIDGSLALPKGRGVQILMRSYALTRGLWQSAQHDEKARTLEIAPSLLLTPERFPHELTEALTEYWRGALTEG